MTAARLCALALAAGATVAVTNGMKAGGSRAGRQQPLSGWPYSDTDIRRDAFAESGTGHLERAFLQIERSVASLDYLSVVSRAGLVKRV